MSFLQRSRVILTGARRNLTGRLGDHYVENGMITLQGVAKDILAWQNHIAVMWQGFPEGDPRIAEHEAAIRAVNGESNEGHIQVGGAVTHGQADVQGQAAGGVPGADQALAIGSVAVAASTGTSDAGAASGLGQPPIVIQPNAKLVAGIARLDDANDAHWTKGGLPAIDAVCKLSGLQGLTRSQIEGASQRMREAQSV